MHFVVTGFKLVGIKLSQRMLMKSNPRSFLPLLKDCTGREQNRDLLFLVNFLSQ